MIKESWPSKCISSPELNIHLQHSEHFIVHSGTDQIGGIILQLISQQCGADGKDDSIFLDFGAIMSISGRYFGNFAELTYHDGLRPLLNLGLLPPIPQLYRKDLPNYPESFRDIKQAWVQSDIFSPTDVSRLTNSATYLHLRGIGYRGVINTHSHWDHSGNIGMLDEDIPYYATPITHSMIKTMELHWGADWKREVIQYRKRNEGKTSNKLPVFHRPSKQLVTDIEVPIASFSVTLKAVSHSALGSAAIDVAYPSGFRLHYTGDLRSGPATQQYTEWLEKNPPNIILIDGTNVGSRKSGVTETQVAEGLFNRFYKEKGPFFIMVPQRQLTRLSNIIREARNAGRRVFAPLALAFYVQQLQSLRHLDSDIPDIEDISVWLHPVKSGKYDSKDYPKEMRELLQSGATDVIEMTELKRLKNPVILLTSQSQLNHLFAQNLFPIGGHYIHSTSEAYDEKGRIDLHRLQRMVKAIGYDYDVLHASGHFSGAELAQFLTHVKSNIIIPLHTANPLRFKALIEQHCLHHPQVLTHLERGLPYHLSGHKADINTHTHQAVNLPG